MADAMVSGGQVDDTPLVRFQGVTKRWGDKVVLKNLSFELAAGKIYGFIGPSGCGKTTSLKLMNGLLEPDEGQIFFRETSLDRSDIREVRRQMGYSVQGTALFPHLTAFGNVTLAAQTFGWAKSELEKRYQEVMEWVQLHSEEFRTLYPHQMSGGQQQRVGIARALFLSPDLILMDEPFSALDPVTRREIHRHFLRLHSHLGFTALLVTHDLFEAFKLSHELLLMNEGELVQRDTPNKLLLNPKGNFVESFLKSNSPGEVLREMDLGAVMNPDILVTLKKEKTWTSGLLERPQAEFQSFASWDELVCFHHDRDQAFVYLCSDEGVFLGALPAKKDAEPLGLQTTSYSLPGDFHGGLDFMLSKGLTVLPLIRENGQLAGVLSAHSIHSL